MIGLHRDLWQHLAPVSVVSALLAVGGFVAMFVWARSLLFTDHTRWGLLVFGIAALGIAYLGLATVPRWYRRASLVVASEKPAQGTITLERGAGSEAANLHAVYRGERYSVLKPRWPVDELLGKPLAAQVYSDPRARRPVAFRVAQGLLWCLPSNFTAAR